MYLLPILFSLLQWSIKCLPAIFTLLPSCEFTWGRFFIGFGIEGSLGVVYSDATQICDLYTESGGTATAQMVPAEIVATSIFPMLQLCMPFEFQIGWVSDADAQCSVLTGGVNSGTLAPYPCTDRASAVFCYYPSTTFTYQETRTVTDVTTAESTSTIFVPSFSSTTITMLTTTPFVTTETDFDVSNTFTVIDSTSVSVRTVTSATTETTIVRSTLVISDIDSITSTFTYKRLSVTLSVSTATQTIIFTTTDTTCDFFVEIK